jgi:hypothetical protein
MDAVSRECKQTTVGLDVSDKYVQACFLDHHGDVVEESRVATTPAALRRRFCSSEGYRVVLEAGIHSPWMSRLLIELGTRYMWPTRAACGRSTKTRARATAWTPSISRGSDAWIPPCSTLCATAHPRPKLTL